MNEKVNSGVDKTLSVLEAVAQHARGLSLAELVRMTGIAKTTAFRILEILSAREFLACNRESGRYTIGIKALEIGLRGLVGQDIVEVSVPYLQELSAVLGETSFLAVYNEGDVVYLYKAEGTASIQTTARLGSRRPAYCTALGKAMLANLPVEAGDRVFEKELPRLTDKTVTDRLGLYEEFARIRSQGYAIDDEGVERGLYCLAVPIYDYTGKVVAAISVSGPVKRMQDNREAVVEALRQAGAAISRRLGFVAAMRR